MKKPMHLLFFSIFFNLSLLSQDFDEDFLDSLPLDIRQELLERTQVIEDLEEPNYRTSVINKRDLDDPEFSQLKLRFGYELFSTMQTSLMPVNEPNLDGNYILDFGDVLELQLIGQKSSSFTLRINRDGSVSIPDIGKIFLSGMSLSQANELVVETIENSFIGVKAFLTLVSIRDIQVIVAGNVFNPGPYTLNGNSNVFHALTVSGGPSKSGSFRKIDLIRNNQVIDTIDLYQTFIFGNSSFGKRLRSGDTIFIHPTGDLISIIGGVKREFIYETLSGENLFDTLSFANGVSVYADLSDIRLFRISKGEIISQKIMELDDLKDVLPQDQDRLVIRKHPFKSVSINGAVVNPGIYLLNEGEGIFAAINRAGGYKDNAYPFGGILENDATKVINRISQDKLYKEFLDRLSILASSPDSIGTSFETMLTLMNEIKEAPVSGRVSAEFDLDTLRNNPNEDVLLQDGDTIIIPELINQVYVFGEVQNQGTTSYISNKDIGFYIDNKGGYKSGADKRNVYILYPDGTTRKVSKNIFQGKSELEVFPGSVIFVPKKINDNFLITKSAQAYATILGNLGVSLASISVLKD